MQISLPVLTRKPLERQQAKLELISPFWRIVLENDA